MGHPQVLKQRVGDPSSFCDYPRIAWVIPCHQEGLPRHMLQREALANDQQRQP